MPEIVLDQVSKSFGAATVNDRQVDEAARILVMDALLDRRPSQLSDGVSASASPSAAPS